MRYTSNEMEQRIRRRNRIRHIRRQRRIAALLITLVIIIGAGAAGGVLIADQNMKVKIMIKSCTRGLCLPPAYV